jgi:SAM-dependent methyltransferase
MAHRSSNRRRNAWAVSLLDVRPHDRVLAIGFGPGLAILELSRIAQQGYACGIDHSELMLRQATRRNADGIRRGVVDLRLASADALPAFDAPSDNILAVNALLFWTEPDARLEELRHVLRPGGLIAVAHAPLPGEVRNIRLGLSPRRTKEGDMAPLYRFEARFTALVPIGPVPDGIRLDAHFEGRVVQGELAGATVRGIDYLRFRSDGVGVLDVREVLTHDGQGVAVRAGGYLIPPAGFALPPADALFAPDFVWPELELPFHGFATFSTAAREWQQLNRTVATFNGVANPGAGTLVVEAQALTPAPVGARVAA